MQTTVGDFLIRRLRELGIEHMFGVPGDYNLQFLDQLQNDGSVEFVGCCNELNAAYAADGYARLRGVSALLTTYGVGDLSAICGIAGAATEHIPMVCITGAPPLHAMRRNLALHHTLAEGNYDDVMICLQQFTVAQARLTPENAVIEIDRVLTACLMEKKPVYLQLPSDVSHVVIDAPAAPLQPRAKNDEARLEAAVRHILTIWNEAQQPAILVDMDADRYGYAGALLDFATATGTPYAALGSGKAVLPETHPLSRGLYGGRNSAPATRELIENSDCLLYVSPRFIEGNSGLFTAQLPSKGAIRLFGHSVEIEGTAYYAVEPRDLLQALKAALANSPAAVPEGQAPRLAAPSPATDAPLSQARLWPRIARFVRAGDVVVAEAGTSNIGLMPQSLPEQVSYINASIWGAIGHTLPAMLGTCMAAPERRHLLFIGDGSFQLTAQELSTLLRYEQKPIIFLVNNRGYTIERFILGMRDAYNDVANWDYQALPGVFAGQDKYLTLSARTETELEQVLQQVEHTDGRLVFVELHLDPFDAPEGLKKFGPATAEFDYGPLGPQRQPQTAVTA
ncbi:thiamine pyrophosphate-binding protein [Pseudomonas sp. S 311-6]|uniref:alpha-keto acid decarboxylase family protein n=1 Tax=Kerstersia gyiorum TaxID=206506 RepID=UPI002097F48B|nr:thiamine pyrophosphate-binding protein [Pseudomonas sp. S 311-6]